MRIQDGLFIAEFSNNNGAATSLNYDETELLVSTNDFFRLGLREANGDLSIVSSNSFHFRYENKNADTLTFIYDASVSFPSLSVRASVSVSNSTLFIIPEIAGVPEGINLEYIEIAQITTSGSGQVLLPDFGGVLLDEPLKQANYVEPGWWFYRHYPGVMHAQYMAYFSGDKGLYIASHDRSHGTKALICKPEDDNNLRMGFRLYCGGKVPDFPIVIKPFVGDWMDAAEIYRDWIQDDPVLPPKGEFPKLVNESPVVIIYPVRGDGDDKGAMTPNEYYPYNEALPVVREYSEAFDSKIMPLLMHWEGTAPWAPPYVWPPYGGEEPLAQFRDSLHQEGHFLGVYCSGTAWTQKSSIIKEYSREKQFEEENLARHMIRGPKGEIDAYICNGEKNQRIGYDMCISQDWTRETVKAEVKKLADFGLDYAQFFDQNLGGASHMCWSEEHNHPQVPGVWQTQDMSSLMAELCAENPNLVLGCEMVAADAYLRYLPLNDMRFGAWKAWGRCVPAYEYVFHEYANNFMGNQCGYTYWEIDHEKSPENLLYRTAYAFNSGNLLSILLKDHGHIHWGWILKWDYPEPEQENIVTLIRNLNDCRKKYPEFLQYGKMLKPLAQITCDEWILVTAHGNRHYDSVLHSSWESPEGRQGQFIVNFLPKKQTIKIIRNGIESEQELTPLSVILLSA